MESLDVQVIRTESELEALADSWNGTLTQSPADCLFLTWEWLSLWWRRFGAGRTLHVITVRHDGTLVGIAPLVLAGGRLEFMGTGAIGSDYLDLIARLDQVDAVIEAVARSIEQAGLNVRFGHMLAGSAADQLARRLSSSFHVCDRVANICPFVPLADHSWETFVSSLGRRHRENVRRRMRKLPADSGFELTQTAEDLRRNFPVLIDLHNRRWDTRGGSDALASSPLQAFHEDFSRIALDRGWLRLFTLRLGERPAAAVYGFHRNGKTLYYQSGVDPTDSAHSLGLVALGFSIRHAIEEGAEEFDFLHGNEDYKFLWTNTTRELLTTDLYRRSWRGRLSMHSHRAIRAARRMARYVVGRR